VGASSIAVSARKKMGLTGLCFVRAAVILAGLADGCGIAARKSLSATRQNWDEKFSLPLIAARHPPPHPFTNVYKRL
jgi:hypothetical protein